MMTNRKPATGSDARARTRKPNAAGIAAAMRYWQQSFAGAGTRPPPATNEKSRDQAAFFGADQQISNTPNPTLPARLNQATTRLQAIAMGILTYDVAVLAALALIVVGRLAP